MKTLQAEYEEMLPEINGHAITAAPNGLFSDSEVLTSFLSIQSCSAGRTGVSGIIGFKMVFKASDLVKLKINDCMASTRRKWVLVK